MLPEIAKSQLQDEEGIWKIPAEVLLNILRLVPNRESVKLTCKKFYSLTCSIERNRQLLINNSKLSDSEIFFAMINSERKFNKLFLDTCKLSLLENFWRLKAVAFKNSNITDFHWESNKLTKVETVNLLSFFQSLKSLEAVSWKLTTELYEEPTGTLSSESLRKLKILKCDIATIEFFKEFLPKNSIHDLELSQEFSENILVGQKSVKILSLNLDCLSPDLLLDMNLTHLKLKLRKYKIDGRSTIQAILKDQSRLTSLDLISCEGCFDDDDEAFIEVCGLKELTVLKTNIDELSPLVFTNNFKKLKELKTLEIESIEHNNTGSIITVLEELSHSNLKLLENLKIYVNDVGLPKDRLERIGKTFISLKSLTIRCENSLPLDTYLKSFKHLQNLNVDFHYCREFSKLCETYDMKCFSLKHLQVQGFGFGSDDANCNEYILLKLVETMPNLVHLEIDAAFPFKTELIFKILEKLKDLKVLKSWSMVQSGNNYVKFDQQSILDLNGISEMVDEFSLELRLKAIDMDISRVREVFSEKLNYELSRSGSYIVIRLHKK